MKHSSWWYPKVPTVDINIQHEVRLKDSPEWSFLACFCSVPLEEQIEQATLSKDRESKGADQQQRQPWRAGCHTCGNSNSGNRKTAEECRTVCGCTARVVRRGGRGTESRWKREGERLRRTPAEELWKAGMSPAKKLQISHVARGPPGSHQSPRPSVSDILGRKALTLSTVELRLLVSKAQSKSPAACYCYTLKLDALCCRLSLRLETEDYKSCQVPRSLKPEQ